jgi:hypothetical protein
MLKSKSEELAKKLGHNKFRATDGWCIDENTGLG